MSQSSSTTTASGTWWQAPTTSTTWPSVLGTDFDFTIIHKAGVHKRVPDAVSRNRLPAPEGAPMEIWHNRGSETCSCRLVWTWMTPRTFVQNWSFMLLWFSWVTVWLLSWPPTTCHLVISKTLAIMQSCFFWSKISVQGLRHVLPSLSTHQAQSQ